MDEIFTIAADALEAARKAGYATTWLPPRTDHKRRGWCIAWKDDELWFLEDRNDGSMNWTFVHRQSNKR